MLIREATVNDIPQISKVAAITYRHTFTPAYDNPDDIESVIQKTRSEIYFLNIIDSTTILVIEQNHTIIGYASISEVENYIDQAKEGDQKLSAIYILPEHQGKGHGKKLLAETLDHPRAKQANRVFLEVWASNEKALRLYQTQGFKKCGTVDVVVDGKVIGEDLLMVRHSK